jgi:hypothetical protein
VAQAYSVVANQCERVSGTRHKSNARDGLSQVRLKLNWISWTGGDAQRWQ